MFFGQSLAKGRKPPSLTAVLGGKSIRLESATMLTVFDASIDGAIVNDGARQIRQDRILIELLDDLGRVCQSAHLFPQPVVIMGQTIGDVRYINPGDRVSFAWSRGSDELSAQWAGWKRMAEAERAGVHNNNANYMGFIGDAGASTITDALVTRMQGVDVSDCIRIRVAD